MRVLLDTHVWVRWLTLQPGLNEPERKAIDCAADKGKVFLAAISLWEVQILHAKGHIQLPLAVADWLRFATAPMC